LRPVAGVNGTSHSGWTRHTGSCARPVGSSRDNAHCARRSPVEATKDAGSIPATSTTLPPQTRGQNHMSKEYGNTRDRPGGSLPSVAGIEKRNNKTMAPTWRVLWRENGQRQYELFTDEHNATQFRRLVEAGGNQWPYGWVKGEGFPGDGSLPVHGTVTKLRDWAEDAVSLRSRASARTKADYRRDLERHVYPYLGALPVDGGITARHVAEWLDALEVSCLAPKTIANIHGLVSSIMSDGMAHRPPVCDHNPFASRLRESPDVRVEEMVFLTPAEFELIHRNVPAFYQLLALLLFATGLRFGEATAVRVADFALDGRRRTLTVVRAWKRQPDGTYRIGEPKTRRGRRTLPLSPKVAALLRAHVKGRPLEALVFPAREGGQMLNSTFHDSAWAPALARASVCGKHAGEPRETPAERTARLALQRGTGRRIRPPAAAPSCDCEGVLTKRPRVHDLRHSHASQLIAEGLPLPVISRRLGHKSIQVTIDRYGHLMPELDDAVNAAVDRGLAWLDDENDD
jgi:integrase